LGGDRGRCPVDLAADDVVQVDSAHRVGEVPLELGDGHRCREGCFGEPFKGVQPREQTVEELVG